MTTQAKYFQRRLNTLAAIKANPEHHCQSQWHCGTSHCFAGFGQLLLQAESENKELETLLEEDYDDLDLSPEINAKYYGLNDDAWLTIIAPVNTIEMLELFVLASITGSDSIDLTGANLRGADLRGVNLGDANLIGADLTGANLSRAYLAGADLSDANLSRANLSGADLSCADLSRAYLSDANLSDANLSGAILSGSDLIYYQTLT